MKFLTDIIYLLAIVAISPKIIYRMIRYNRYRTGWDQRLGKITRRTPDKKCIWIHAVSVGEVNATKTLIAGLKERLNDYEIVLSSTTDTGFKRAQSLYSDKLKVFYFPFDVSFIIQRAFENIRPDVCLLMELEVWPNLTQIANKMKVPVVVVNGRLSDKSFPRYKLIKPVIRKVFEKVDLVLAQTTEYAQRFKELGCLAERVIVTNSLKYDTAEITNSAEGANQLSEQLNLCGDILWVAGATGPGEEKIVLEVFKKLTEQENCRDLRVAIVPRKPERFDEIAALIEESGLEYLRLSHIKNEQKKPVSKPPVILGDTMGDLRKFYSLATVVFVGRSLVPMGGSDMMEPTALRKCTIFGPHAFNFKQTVDALLTDQGAIVAKNGEELFEIMKKCLTDVNLRDKIAAAGQQVIKQNQGATKRTVEAICNLINQET